MVVGFVRALGWENTEKKPNQVLCTPSRIQPNAYAGRTCQPNTSAGENEVPAGELVPI